jgi:hypothetical protein
MLNEIFSCEVCGKQTLQSVLNLGLHPLCDDLVPIGNARVCKEYPIEILFCDNCITAHQRFQLPQQQLFPQDYHYRSRQTLDVLQGMRSLVDSCEQYGLAEKKIMDIGCNDGSLLSFFSEKKAKTWGIEPTGAFSDAVLAGHHVINDFFCEKIAKEIVRDHGQFDIIVFTNVFAHIENLAETLSGLKILMHDNSIVIIENHYLGAILDKFQFDTFYHEHPRTYSLTSFIHIAKHLNRQISTIEFPSRYNGNIRITLVPEKDTRQQPSWNAIHEKELSFGKSLAAMQKKLEIWRQKTEAYIQLQVKNHGKLSAKAFPGRAAIPIKLLGLNENVINVVYEQATSAKINHYVPGTRIPILPDTLLELSSQSPLINFAWHIRDEIKAYLLERGFSGPILDILPDLRCEIL